jgi:hypothetical protein
LEVPVVEEPKEEPEATRFVTFEEATPVEEASPDSTRVLTSPVLETKDTKAAVAARVDDSGHKSKIVERPSLSEDNATAMIMRSQLDLKAHGRPAEEKTSIQTKREAQPEVTGKTAVAQSEKTQVSTRKPMKAFPYSHHLVSFLMIAVCAEVASLVAFGFQDYAFSPIPSPGFGVGMAALFALISGAFFYVGKRQGRSTPFQDYFRTFAYHSLFFIPFALSFAFPKSVVVFASLLLATAWVVIFAKRHFSDSPNFVTFAAGGWVAVLIFSFQGAARLHLDPVIHSNDESIRGIASVPETAVSTTPNPAMPQAQAPATAPAQISQAPAAAPVPPQPAAQTQAPASNPVAAPSPAQQPVTNAAASLDPLAVEQFFNAVKSGNLNMVESLVDRHIIDPVFTLQNGSSALHFAASDGDLPMVRYLIKKRVTIDAQDAGGTTPLMWATYHHHADVVEYLIKKKANLGLRRDGGDRAIDLARRNQDKKIYTLLREAMKARSVAAAAAHSKSHSRHHAKRHHSAH